jgi:hypothetical protein
MLLQTIRRGFCVLENGEVATWLGIFQMDLIKGASSAKSYTTKSLSDGSTIIFGVIPGEERLTEPPGIFYTPKPIWEIGAVFDGFEMGF